MAGKKPANQGGVAKASVKPAHDQSAKPSNSAKSAGVGLGNVSFQVTATPVGGTGTTHSEAKPFKKK